MDLLPFGKLKLGYLTSSLYIIYYNEGMEIRKSVGGKPQQVYKMIYLPCGMATLI